MVPVLYVVQIFDNIIHVHDTSIKYVRNCNYYQKDQNVDNLSTDTVVEDLTHIDQYHEYVVLYGKDLPCE